MGDVNKLKVLFFIPVWRRIRITEVCYKALERIRNRMKFDSDVLIVYSEPEHKKLAKKYGYNAVYSPNTPVGSKLNNGMEFALKSSWDYVFQLNSDDVLHNNILNHFESAIDNREPFASVEKLYVYDSETESAKEYRYTGSGCGVRIISREWIDGAGWQQYCNVKRSAKGPHVKYLAGENRYLPVHSTNKRFISPLSANKVFRLWSPDLNKGLDNDSRKNMFGAFGEPIGWIKGVNDRPLFVDIKSGTNIWKYDQLQGRELETKDVSNLFKEYKELTDLLLVSHD